MADTLAGPAAAARAWAAASRPWAVARFLRIRAIRAFWPAGTGFLPARAFPAATAAWYFSITAAWASSARASRCPARRTASRAAVTLASGLAGAARRAARVSSALVWIWVNSSEGVSAWVSVFVVAIVRLLLWSAVAPPEGRGTAVDRNREPRGVITGGR